MVIPVAKSIVLLFGPPAFFMMAILGLTSLVAASDNLLRGLIAACVGLFVAFIGYDEIGGEVRYTAGIDYLWDGLSLVPVLIGLFAIAEMAKLFVKGGTIAQTSADGDQTRITGTLDGVKAVFKNPKTLLAGSTIGSLVGMVPGVGGTVASFMSYSFTAQFSKNNENFGKGDIRGVIALEASNNAKDGGSLIPTLAFGIPGSAEMALFLGVLVLHGMTPGPMLLIEREYSIFVLILALLLSTIFGAIVMLSASRYLVKITYIDSSILIPTVISIAMVGAYALHGSIGDVFAAGFFGLLGYLMIRFDYPRITFVIALVLGSLMERSFTQSLLMFQGDWTRFMTKGTSRILFILTVIALLVPILHKVRKYWRAS